MSESVMATLLLLPNFKTSIQSITPPTENMLVLGDCDNDNIDPGNAAFSADDNTDNVHDLVTCCFIHLHYLPMQSTNSGKRNDS